MQQNLSTTKPSTQLKFKGRSPVVYQWLQRTPPMVHR